MAMRKQGGTDMRIKEEIYSRDSLAEFEEEIRTRVDACTGIVHVRAGEIIRAAVACRRVALTEGSLYTEWDINRGFVDYTVSEVNDLLKEGSPCPQFPTALKTMFDRIMQGEHSGKIHYFVFVDPSKMWESPAAIDYLRKAAALLPQTDYRMIVITGDAPAPPDIADIVSTVHMLPPGFAELQTSADSIMNAEKGNIEIDGVSEEMTKALCFSASGMSQQNFEDTLSLAMMRHHDGKSVDMETLIREVGRGKTEVVNRNDILELYTAEDIENVGGMENLKNWISSRASCYSDEAHYGCGVNKV